MNNLNDTTLVELVLGGDTEAFSALVGRYSDRVFALARQVSGNREDAEEITQDAFLKVFEHLGQFRRASSFSSWLYRVAYNTAISYLRRNKQTRMTVLIEESKLKAEADPDLEETGPGAFSREEQLSRLERALESLPAEDRALVQLFYLEDKPVREVAEIMGYSENNVKTRLHRIRKRLGVIYGNIELKDATE